jgi:hypothetical protein
MGETVLALAKIDSKLNPDKLLKQFKEVAKEHTQQADTQFDADGRPIEEPIHEGFDDSVVIVEDNIPASGIEEEPPVEEKKPKRKRTGKRAKKTSGQDELFEE